MTLPILEQLRRKALLEQGLKRCSKCNQIKSLFQFTIRRSKSDSLSSQCKCCQDEYRKWYRDDPENVARERASSRAWKERNYEQVLAYSRMWGEQNKEQKRYLRRRWHLAHQEEENAKSRIKVRKWEIANREHCRTRLRLRRAKERNAEGSHTEEQWLQLVALLDHRCTRCRKKKKLSLDHIIPVAWGGSHYLANVQPLCRKCNSRKGDRYAADYRPAHVRAWSWFQSFPLLESGVQSWRLEARQWQRLESR